MGKHEAPHANPLKADGSKGAAAPAPPKRADKMSELPPGRVLDDTSFELKGKLRENLIVYAPNSASATNGATPVWLLATQEYLSNAGKTHLAYFQLRDKLQHKKMQIVGSVMVTPELIKTMYENSAQNINEDNSNKEQQGELYDYYNKMISYALKESVSDIHIEKRSTRSVIRMRKHGQLVEYAEQSNVFVERLCRVLHMVLAENKEVTFRAEDVYQSASVNTNIAGEEVKLRYQSLPVYPGGYDVVLRVLPIGKDEESITPLEKLGYAPNQVKMLLEIASRPIGALVISGVTGSGKSTTLKNLLMYINNARQYRCKIFTIEDPPEYKIPRVSQIPVLTDNVEGSEDSPFVPPLKACMRGDPDILMIGEIRDKHTGDGLKKATQSGHQVLTTVHAASALGIVPRLMDFGIDHSVIGSSDFLNGLVYQKLLPLLCPHCAIDFKEHIASSRATQKDVALSRRLEKVSNFAQHTILIRGPGCDHCKNMGINGRTVCAEIIAPDYAMLEMFQQNNLNGARYYWRSMSDKDQDSEDMRGKTVLEHALYKMRLGLVCPYDIEELIGPVDQAQITWDQMEEKHNKDKHADTNSLPRLNIGRE